MDKLSACPVTAATSFGTIQMGLYRRRRRSQDPGSVGKIPSVAFTDFDNRRDIDFWMVNQGSAVRLFSNQRVGTFLDIQARLEGVEVKDVLNLSVGDYNKDGWMDGNGVAGRPVNLVRNLGNGTFRRDAVLSAHLPLKIQPKLDDTIL
jgi:hypothetical protein